MRQSVLRASSAATASGTSSAVNTSKGHELTGSQARVALDVTAVSGTSPTMDVKVMGMINDVAYQVGTFSQVTAVGKQTIVIDACPDFLYLDWTIAGTTPSFTFEAACCRN